MAANCSRKATLHKLGVELVEGRDLFGEDDQVFMRATLGPRRVEVIYRRVDDHCLDLLVFNSASVLGVPERCATLPAALAPGDAPAPQPACVLTWGR